MDTEAEKEFEKNFQAGAKIYDSLDLDKIFNKEHPSKAEKHKCRKAVNHFKKCLEIHPDDDGIWFLKGVLENVLEKFPDSLKSLENAYKLENKAFEIPTELTTVCLEMKKHKKAVIYSEAALKLEKNPGTYFNYAVALTLDKKPKQAKKIVRQALKLKPRDKQLKKIDKYIDRLLSKEEKQPAHIGALEKALDKASPT